MARTGALWRAVVTRFARGATRARTGRRGQRRRSSSGSAPQVVDEGQASLESPDEAPAPIRASSPGLTSRGKRQVPTWPCSAPPVRGQRSEMHLRSPEVNASPATPLLVAQRPALGKHRLERPAERHGHRTLHEFVASGNGGQSLVPVVPRTLVP